MALKLISAFFIMCIATQAIGAPCNLSNIKVSQTKTDRIVEGQHEYRVVITNNCECSQSQVIVKCWGLRSVEPVARSAIAILNEEDCLLNHGAPITKLFPVAFNYVWLNPQNFPIVSSKIKC